eukprot:SAG11_NODE_38420_length_252_cov_0.993464_1_plen_34_part_10
MCDADSSCNFFTWYHDMVGHSDTDGHQHQTQYNS